MSWNTMNKEAYEQTGRKYDFFRPKEIYSYLARFFGRFITGKMKKNSLVLDLGCGTGNSTYFLDNILTDCEIHGVDQAKNMLKEVENKRFKNKTRFFNTAIERFKPRKKYDAVLIFQVVHHFQDTKPLLEALKRVTKKGGMVYFIDTFTKNRFVRLLAHLYQIVLGQGKYVNRDYEEMSRQLMKFGFKIKIKKDHPVLRNYSLIAAEL